MASVPDHIAPCLPPKILSRCFSWELKLSQEKSKTVVKKNWGVGGGGGRHLVNYGLCENGELRWVVAF